MIFGDLSQQREQERISRQSESTAKGSSGSSGSSKRISWGSNNPYKAQHRRQESTSSWGSIMSRGHPLRGSGLRESMPSGRYQYQTYNPSNVVILESPPSTPSYPAAFSYIARFLNQSGMLSTPFQSKEFLPNPPPKDRKSTDILKWLGSNRHNRYSVAPTEISVNRSALSTVSSPDLPFVSATDLSSQLDPLPHQLLNQRLKQHSEPLAPLDSASQQLEHERQDSESMSIVDPIPRPRDNLAEPKFRVAHFSENFSSRSDVQYRPHSIFLPTTRVDKEAPKARKRLSKNPKPSQISKKEKKERANIEKAKANIEKMEKERRTKRTKLQKRNSSNTLNSKQTTTKASRRNSNWEKRSGANWDRESGVESNKKRATCSCM
jgi:hypothetical protein